MAVKDVWGKLNNGSEVFFDRKDIKTWEVTVGTDTPDGHYVAEVWASDYAGNIAYKMAVVWIKSGKVTCLRFIEDKYSCRYICPAKCEKGGVTMSDDKSIRYLLGEKRILEFEAYAEDGTDFIIDDATYTVYRYNRVIDSGIMNIDGHKLSHMFIPSERGYYLFEISYKVGKIVKMYRFNINVD